MHEFPCNQGAVLALVAKDDTIYAACQNGYVRIFDLETKTLVRTIIVQEVNLNTLSSHPFEVDEVTYRALTSLPCQCWGRSFIHVLQAVG